MYIVVRSRKTQVGRAFDRVYKLTIEKIRNKSCLVVYDDFGRCYGASGEMPMSEYRIEEVCSDEIY